MHCVTVKDDVFSAEYTIIYGCSSEEFYKTIVDLVGIAPEKSDDIRPWNSLMEGMEINGEIHCFMFLSENYFGLSGLAHELIHAVVYTFDTRGIPIDIKTDEVFAWYYDYLLTKLYSKMETK